MIISKTPYRISFFGGGTDYPEWYKNHGGKVLSTTIDKYCYVTCRTLPPFFSHKYRIAYSKVETVSRIEDIEHPVVRAALTLIGRDDGLEIHHDGDLPARSGLGSSSTFTVGLLHALHAMAGVYRSSGQLANEAIHIEQDVLKEFVGSQDQIAAAYGGLNKIDFFMDEEFDVTPVVVDQEKMDDLQSHLMFFFTGLSRYASEIAESKIANIGKRYRELSAMGQMVDAGLEILGSKNTPISEFGRLLNESWKFKRSLSEKVSTAEIDQMYEAALSAGATGGKITGAGGGGFLLLFVPPEKQARVRASLAKLTYVPFKFEQAGSRIVLYQPNGLA